MYLDRFNLNGRVAVVTGGAQGIGLACVEALGGSGRAVYIADCNPKERPRRTPRWKPRAMRPTSSKLT